MDFWGQWVARLCKKYYFYSYRYYLLMYLSTCLDNWHLYSELQDCAKNITFIDLTYLLMYMFGHLTFVNCTTVKERFNVANSPA